jgi:transcriptional regulator with XRE-family HTH domain
LIDIDELQIRPGHYQFASMTPHASILRLGILIGDLRRSIGWSQRELAARAGVSQGLVSAIENGRLPTITFATATRLLEAMGARLILDVAAPFLGDRQLQRDPAHVRCVTFVARRLGKAGWQVATEVEIGGDRSRGWIDILAFHPITHVQLVIEIKTEIRDLGAIERSLGWYERESWAAARRRGWRPSQCLGALMVLTTTANDERFRQNRDALAFGFPTRARELSELVSTGVASGGPGRAVAMIDPGSLRADWLRRSRLDGRRSPAPYDDYADFMRRRRIPPHAPCRTIPGRACRALGSSPSPPRATR